MDDKLRQRDGNKYVQNTLNGMHEERMKYLLKNTLLYPLDIT